MQHRTVVLVTHHVELVLSGAYYIVRMGDGRIDLQGEVAALRASGQLDDIAHGEEHAALEDEHVVAEKPPLDSEETDAVQKGKKPRKLVEEEHRAAGYVKWPVYKIYLVAS